jgi:RHS repeat-associated protein
MTRVYNEAGQLKQQKDIVTATAEVISQFDFSYDKAGNITQELVIPPPQPPQFTIPTNMTYGVANRLATYNEFAIQFDADGNMTRGPLSGEMADFIFDSRNRLQNVGGTVYHYDAENQRIGINQTRYVINSQPVLSQVLVRTKGNGEVTYYVYGLGLIGEARAGNYFSYHYDLRGSTIALTNEIGQVVERFQYSPYGLLMYGDASRTPFLFNGMYGVMSDSNGLYYMRARFYSPEMRKFVNQDIVLGKITNGQSLNQFAYVNGNPVSYVDPEGKLGFLAGLAIVSAALFAYDIYSAITFDPSVYDFDSGAVVPTALPIVEDVIGGAAKGIQKGISACANRFNRKIPGAQFPKMAPYAPNINGPRIASEAIELARSKGIEIPDDLVIGFIKNWTRTDADAEYFFQLKSYKPNDWVKWSDFYHDQTNKIPVRFNAALLNSDEALIAHIAHEMHELNALRQIFEDIGGEMRAADLRRFIASGITRNLHDQAWDIADELVRAMR